MNPGFHRDDEAMTGRRGASIAPTNGTPQRRKNRPERANAAAKTFDIGEFRPN
jgi:hypothetical protein